jgi:hypothetical protein
MIYRLVILSGDRRGERITVAPEPMSIGRDAACDIRLEDAEVALSHAKVSHTTEGLLIRDGGSMNRLLVNGYEVREAHLKHGDVIEVGRTRLLVQAYVQAEVQGGEEAPGRRARWLAIGGVAALAIAVLGAAYVYGPRSAAAPRATPRHAPRSLAARAAGSATNVPSAVAPAPVPKPDGGETGSPSAVRSPAPRAPDPAVATAVAEVNEARGIMETSNSAPAIVDTVAVARKDLEDAANTLLESKVKDMLGEARGMATNEGPAAAERMLATIEKIKPDFLEAPAARAAMLEEQGKLDPAVALWTDLRERGAGTPLAGEADSRLKVLARARTECVAPFAGRVKITGAGMTKFPETETFREMRLLTVRLAATELQKELDARAVRAEVWFYDRNRQGGGVVPTSAKVPTNTMMFAGIWRATEERAVEVSYLVPANVDAAARPAEYYGFIVRLYYYGGLQDEWAQPRDLPGDVTLAAPGASPATNGPGPAAVAIPPP